MLIPLYSGINV